MACAFQIGDRLFSVAQLMQRAIEPRRLESSPREKKVVFTVIDQKDYSVLMHGNDELENADEIEPPMIIVDASGDR